MYCPECGSEYREGFTQCVDCEVPLTAEPPAQESGSPNLELVTVMEVEDPGRLALAESLLMEAEIPYTKKNEHVQDLFAAGRIFSNPVVGPILIQVTLDRAEEAQALLDDLDSAEVDYSFYDDEEDGGNGDEAE